MAIGIGTWAVMCCGCRRMLASDGSIFDPAAEALKAGGMVSIPRFRVFNWDAVASFAHKAAADEEALKAGWQTEDSEGSNHRCPDCVRRGRNQEPSTGRGAFVEFGNDAALAAQRLETMLD